MIAIVRTREGKHMVSHSSIYKLVEQRQGIQVLWAHFESSIVYTEESQTIFLDSEDNICNLIQVVNYFYIGV